MVGWFRKKRIENNRANRTLGLTSVDSQKNVSTHYPFYVEYRVEDKDVIIDASNVEFHDFGRHRLNKPTGWKSPCECIHKKLAFEMGWVEEDPAVADPQFAVKMGPNIVMETRGNFIPYSSDIITGYPGSHRIPSKIMDYS